jgi:glutamyl-Q tRNA(Asp) synthetase
LHFGSLIAAVGSFLDARHAGGRWLVRMEDLDPPREMPGAADTILRTLDALGLHWDGPVLYQSTRSDAYQAALDALQERNLLYPCACTRQEIRDNARPGKGEAAYAGTCSDGLPPGREPRSVRVRVDGADIRFTDRLQGPQRDSLPDTTGDFIVRRADGLFAYQLAVVVDDAAQGVTDIVRGSDLLDNTARQIWLQRCLGAQTPRYLHLPVAVNAAGSKLSKQTFAPALDAAEGTRLLWRALQFLGQRPPPALADTDPAAFWDWAVANWNPGRIDSVMQITSDRGR